MTHRRLRAVSWMIFVALAWIATPASAHVVALGGVSGFGSGFAHPFSGLDHQLAMLAVGLWSWQQAGRRKIALPLLFVAGASAGLGLGSLASSTPIAPAVLAGSVAALGLGAALALRSGFALSLVAVFACGLVHGHAHASDLAACASQGSFAAGFLLATALLHALGFALGAWGPARARAGLVRAAGSAIAVTGSLLLVLALR